jgi:hypothetical protein
MLKNILIVLVVLVLGFLGFVATRPNDYSVERSALISAPPEVVYAQVVDFHKWGAWSPWEHLDPDMKREIAGPESGTGATYAWAGNDKAGEGKMTITDATPAERVAIDLQFIKPWESTCATVFGMAPEGGGTRVNWTMSGKHNFISKAMCVFMPMDKMIGPDFERGLASLDSVSAVIAATGAHADSMAAPAN